MYCLNEQPPTQFKFTLHFVGADGPVSWDPIGDGQNGPRGASDMWAAGSYARPSHVGR